MIYKTRMLSDVFGSLLASPKQDGGRKKPAPRGAKKNGTGKPFMAYEKLTLEELQKKAKSRKLKYSGLTKDKLIQLLRK